MAQIEIHSFTCDRLHHLDSLSHVILFNFSFLSNCPPLLLCVYICMQVLHSQGLRVGWGMVV